ncbi:MAG: hypothetical protein WBL06_01710 [Pseudolysinimonas sp.]|jgi:hypothetical protein|uniref:hypothetical protein n=1 Tax=Pseudolysinimonas sp. TaxID=2680009 RepID=UPI003C74134C
MPGADEPDHRGRTGPHQTDSASTAIPAALARIGSGIVDATTIMLLPCGAAWPVSPADAAATRQT